MPATPADRLLALLLTQPAEHWLPLAKIIRANPDIRWPALVLQNLGKQGLVERRSDHADVYYRASRQAYLRRLDEQITSTGGGGRRDMVTRATSSALQKTLAGKVAEQKDDIIGHVLTVASGAQALAAVAPPGQRVARGAARALQLAGAVAPVDVAIRGLEPLSGAQAVAAMTGGER